MRLNSLAIVAVGLANTSTILAIVQGEIVPTDEYEETIHRNLQGFGNDPTACQVDGIGYTCTSSTTFTTPDGITTLITASIQCDLDSQIGLNFQASDDCTCSAALEELNEAGAPISFQRTCACTVCPEALNPGQAVALDCTNVPEDPFIVGPCTSLDCFGRCNGTGTGIGTGTGVLTDAPNVDNVPSSIAPSSVAPTTSPSVAALPLTLTVEEFCSDLSNLEQYLTGQLREFITVENSTPFTCSCSEPDDVTLLANCVMMYYLVSEENYTYTEHGTWKLNNNGMYDLTRTSTTDTYYGVGLEQSFDLDPTTGLITGCTVVGCASCSACSDGMSVAIDCTTLAPDLQWDNGCDVGNPGAFMNFYKGVVLVGPTSEPTGSPDTNTMQSTTSESSNGSSSGNSTVAIAVPVVLMSFLFPLWCAL